MNQYDFDILLQKYISGECTPEEEKQVFEWSESMLQNSSVSINASEKEMINQRIWKKLHLISRPDSIFRKSWMKLGLAASVLIVLASLMAVLWPKVTNKTLATKTAEAPLNEQLSAPKGNIEVKNTSDKPYTISLSDGSLIVLQPRSSLSYPEHFAAGSRTVYLNGEAFFTVKKDSSRPFFVYAGQLVTQVLGTSFNVKSYQTSRSIEVAVVTGRVSVYENSKRTPQSRNGIILTPNQKIRFDKDMKVLVPELVEEPVVVNPPEKKSQFIFEETPLNQVITTIQDAYGVEIVMEAPDLKNCVFTGDINDLPLYSQLKLICKAINANYELRGTTFFINGKGCQN